MKACRVITLICFSALALVVASCQSGHVNIQPTGPQSPTSVQESPGSTYSDLLNESESPASVVYFTAVEQNDENQSIPEGIGFLPTNSQTTQADVYRIPLDAMANPARQIAPWENGFIYIKNIDQSHDAVSFTDVLSLNSKDLFVPGGRIQSLAVSSNLQRAGWIDSNDKVYLLDGTSGKVSELELNDFVPVDLQFGGTDKLLVMGATTGGAISNPSKILEFSLDKTATYLDKKDGISAAVSDSGRFLALVNSAPHPRDFTVLDKNNPNQVLTVETADKGLASQFRWDGDRYLAFLLASKSQGKLEVRVADLTMNTSIRVAGLEMVGNTPTNTVCPTWKDGVLYFSGLSGGQSVIFRSQKLGSQWSTTVFARPAREEQGFVCPQTVESGD